MDDGQWWVLRDGITLGPYGLAELRQYTTRGKLLADDLVSAAGEVEWTPAAHARALQDLFPKDGSEDATVALEPALRAMAAPPVPARRTSSADNPLRGTTLPPRPPATDDVATPKDAETPDDTGAPGDVTLNDLGPATDTPVINPDTGGGPIDAGPGPDDAGPGPDDTGPAPTDTGPADSGPTRPACPPVTAPTRTDP